MKAAEVLSCTPREFTIMLQAQNERQYDEFERMAQAAIMRERAHRAKSPKASDLFKRPSANDRTNRVELSDMKEKTQQANAWLSTLVSGKE